MCIGYVKGMEQCLFYEDLQYCSWDQGFNHFIQSIVKLNLFLILYLQLLICIVCSYNCDDSFKPNYGKIALSA